MGEHDDVNDVFGLVDIYGVPAPPRPEVVDVDPFDVGGAPNGLEKQPFGAAVDPPEPPDGAIEALQAPIAALPRGGPRLVGEGSSGVGGSSSEARPCEKGNQDREREPAHVSKEATGLGQRQSRMTSSARRSGCVVGTLVPEVASLRLMRRVLLLIVLSGLVESPADAALVVPHTLESLDEAADLVIRGRVGQQWSKWDEAHRRIWTYTEIEVLEDLRGSGTAPELVTVRILGGTVGEVSMRMSGAPELTPGDELVLFLRAAGPEQWSIVGLSQGAFRLQRRDELVLAIPLLEGLAFVPLRTEQVGQTRLVRMALSRLRRALAGETTAPRVPETPAAPELPGSPPSIPTEPPPTESGTVSP